MVRMTLFLFFYFLMKPESLVKIFTNWYYDILQKNKNVFKVHNENLIFKSCSI